MEPNQNPPSEREWTVEERKEFLESLDALTCGFNDFPKPSPIEWSTGSWNGPITPLDPEDPFGDMERIFNRGIHVTSIISPEFGWPVAFHCPLCRTTTFALVLWAIKPKDGDYQLMHDVCVDAEHGYQHNMTIALNRTRG